MTDSIKTGIITISCILLILPESIRKDVFTILKNHIRTPEEIEKYMHELKNWLNEAKNTPPEEMSEFFTRRIDIYENVHLEKWGQEYRHIGDFFDNGLTSLLDIGCGTGLELASIYKRFPNVLVTGIDLSASMLSKLRSNYAGKSITLIQDNYFTYPFEKNKYDAALSVETLHHFEYDKKGEIYKKLFQALKDKGYYIECDYIACCPEEEALCLKEYRNRREKSGVSENTFLHIDIPLTLEHQTALIKGAGFQKISVLYQNGSTVILRADK